MNSMIATTIAAVVLALPLGLAPVSASAQDENDCVSALEAQQAVEAGEILELPDAAARAGVNQKYIDNQARLCEVDGSPHWIVNVMNELGNSQRIVLNALGD
jgi:hypothetical protein